MTRDNSGNTNNNNDDELNINNTLSELSDSKESTTTTTTTTATTATTATTDNSNVYIYKSYSICNDEKILVQEYRNGVAMIILNRPKALNSLDIEMLTSLKNILRKFEGDNRIKVVLIKSIDGSRAFCSGGDIRQFASYQGHFDSLNHFVKTEYCMDYIIHTFPKPIITIVNGIVMGGGVGLSVHSNYRVVTENVVWAMPENVVGFLPDVGTTYFLSRLGAFGLYLALTGDRIGARDLISTKLASHYIPLNILDQVLQEISTDDNVENHRQIGFILNKYSKTLPLEGKEMESVYLKYKDSIQRCFGYNPKSVQDIMNRLEEEKIKYNTEWGSKTIEKLLNSCPLSLLVCFESLKRALHLDIEQVFEMETRLGTRLAIRPDLYEGVTKSMVKRTKPNWSFPTIDSVPIDYFNSLFDPFENQSHEFDINY
ncbi:hypothetical protein CYY_004791 [Polysphondylium violaceum]|uniref:Enoyl-CoA hydratase/isomerase domain-containing protein n=1 Tax=Polysphondylium violaceum TaxID=133409 RepID=A0A8J4V041_9MYCE|nr:hypothetical protein CYY_004791 [Polysphondylium violaceum]